MAGGDGHPRSQLQPGVLSCTSRGSVSGMFTSCAYPLSAFTIHLQCMAWLCAHPGNPCIGFIMINFLRGASAMLSSWQRSAATNDAVSSVPLQAQASLSSRFCSGGAGVSLPVSSGTLRTGYFQCAEHVSVQLCVPSPPQNHTSLSLPAGCLGDGEVRSPLG